MATPGNRSSRRVRWQSGSIYGIDLPLNKLIAETGYNLSQKRILVQNQGGRVV